MEVKERSHCECLKQCFITLLSEYIIAIKSFSFKRQRKKGEEQRSDIKMLSHSIFLKVTQYRRWVVVVGSSTV